MADEGRLAVISPGFLAASWDYGLSSKTTLGRFWE